jgi:hypothetical protein
MKSCPCWLTLWRVDNNGRCEGLAACFTEHSIKRHGDGRFEKAFDGNGNLCAKGVCVTRFGLAGFDTAKNFALATEFELDSWCDQFVTEDVPIGISVIFANAVLNYSSITSNR